MDTNEQLKNYIYQQLQMGLHPEEISQQLRGAGWGEDIISSAFKSIQHVVVPASQPSHPSAIEHGQATSPADGGVSHQSSAAVQHYDALGKKRGSIKTSWLLLKQSLKILRSNKQLVKYPLFGGLYSIIILIIFAAIFIFSGDTFARETTDIYGRSDVNLTPVGYMATFIYIVLANFIVFIYNTGLAANVLDIFHGKTQDRKHYMQLAWSKRSTIFVYSIITATVGMILRTIAERSRFLGYIVSRILGAVWSLANIFTIPIIAETNDNATSAIKSSTRLFVSRWGENIAARVTFGGIAFLIYLIIFVPVLILVAILSSSAGTYGFVFWFVTLLIGVMLFAVVETAAGNILSTALYYFAKYQQIPAAFEPGLLNAVFVPKKKRRGKETK